MFTRRESMAEKQLIILVDVTAAMAPHWTTIVSDYLEKIIRHFCGHSTGKEPSSEIVELVLVKYKASRPCSGPDWDLKGGTSGTTNMETFLGWLLDVTFEGGGLGDAYIVEGLAEALLLCQLIPKLPIGSQERHCILVAASDPFPLSLDLNLLRFTQCFKSLSVISPKQLPKLRELYNAGNSNHNGTDPSLYNAKNPQFLVLLSENFLEARAALDQQETMSTSSTNSAVAVRTNSVPSDSNFQLDLSEEALTLLQQEFGESSLDQKNSPAGNIPTETSKVEPINLAQRHQIMISAAEAGENSGGHSTMSIVKESTHDLESFLRTPQNALNIRKQLCAFFRASGNLNNSNPAELGDLRTVQPFESFQRTKGNGHLQSRVSQGGQSSVSSSAGTSFPLVEMAKEFFAATDLEYKHNRYVVAWEGDMHSKYQGLFVHVSRLRAYRKISAPETLTADWPQALQMGCVIPQRSIDKITYDDHAESMIFRAFNNHPEYEKLKEKELYVRINLPSQTLIFAPTDKKCQFIGILLPVDFPPLESCEQQQNDQATEDEGAGNDKLD